MSGFVVRQPGLLSLLHDRGRYGAHDLGLTTGGPLDFIAFDWANRLLGNDPNATCLEVSFGGLTLEADTATSVVVTGAEAPCKLNGAEFPQWQTVDLAPGDRLEIGFAIRGTRTYLAVSGGFDIAPSFGSSSTVVREKIGGLCGDKLQAQDHLPCSGGVQSTHYRLDAGDRPRYGDFARLRVVPGYQQDAFDAVQQWRFFSSEYRLTERCDRMGFRLEGESVHSQMVGMLSEGICLGAIQIPADGQPIVLMNDRQTIGGYPKIGSVIAQDTARLSQLSPGAAVRFDAISIEQAHNIHCLERARFERTRMQPC
ncbi:MAG: biotin-dependent carboxyltransferase family protein [Gammaproteobacteria bacterium]|nr:biotin-dependent carboxyltransferase family protein [Gammaproteobacteria bacterium]MDH3447690.1 biotin-dependent carboxyltransferase family protein [Gammaproteobacteria bacterium]